ncbi:MAG: class IV adenylate cyclase [Acidobacteriota bacterium]
MRAGSALVESSQSMPIEYEVKLAGEPQELQAALERAGARPCGPRLLEDDLVLDTPNGRLAAAGHLLRLRRRGGQYLLTHKGAVDETVMVKARPEWQSAVEDGTSLLSILENLGYVVTVRYQKYRRAYCLGGVQIALDQTPIGWFLEVEGDPEAIERAAGLLGFNSRAYELRSYLRIYRDRGGRGDMLFDGPESAAWTDLCRGRVAPGASGDPSAAASRGSDDDHGQR